MITTFWPLEMVFVVNPSHFNVYEFMITGPFEMSQFMSSIDLHSCMKNEIRK